MFNSLKNTQRLNLWQLSANIWKGSGCRIWGIKSAEIWKQQPHISMWWKKCIFVEIRNQCVTFDREPWRGFYLRPLLLEIKCVRERVGGEKSSSDFDLGSATLIIQRQHAAPTLLGRKRIAAPIRSRSTGVCEAENRPHKTPQPLKSKNNARMC